MSAPALPATGTITMFSTTWCGYCRRLKSALDREGIGYTEVNIEDDPRRADYVMSVNGGNQTVPTVVFPDGSAATNPSLAEVKDPPELSCGHWTWRWPTAGFSARHPVRARHLQPQHEPAVLDHGPAVVVPVLVLAGDEPVDLDQLLDRVVGRRRRDLREGAPRPPGRRRTSRRGWRPSARPGGPGAGCAPWRGRRSPRPAPGPGRGRRCS